MKTMIDAVAHDATEGKVLVNGVAYSIKQGKTLVGGVAYDIGGNVELSQKGLWADARLLGIGGNNSSKNTTVKIRTITSSDAQVYILFFVATGMAVYTVSGTNSGDNFTPTGGITLIYSRGLPPATGDLITIEDGRIQSTQNYYGATMAAISFPSYTVDQVTSVFGGLTYVAGSGQNASTRGNLTITVTNEQASSILFLAVGSTLRAYVCPFDTSETYPAYTWSSGGNYGLKYFKDLGKPAYWAAILETTDLKLATYGGTLIAFKEAA